MNLYFQRFRTYRAPEGDPPVAGDPPKAPPAGDPPKDPPPQDPPKDPPKDPPAGDPPKTPPATWQENWRELYATGADGKVDEKKLGKLQRYATPAAAFDALAGLQAKIGAGELRSTLPKDATPEQVKTWRAENGIPESPDKYELSLPNGVKVADEDKAIVDGILKDLHGVNANNQVASTVVDLYYRVQEQMTQQRVEADAKFNEQAQDALRAEWGNEYRLNMNMVNGLVATMPAEVREMFSHGRLANGDPILSHPGVLKSLVAWSRQINPVTTVVPNAGADVAGAIETEIAQIEKTMRTDRKAYNADEKMQARYRELVDARDRAKGQKAA